MAILLPPSILQQARRPFILMPIIVNTFPSILPSPVFSPIWNELLHERSDYKSFLQSFCILFHHKNRHPVVQLLCHEEKCFFLLYHGYIRRLYSSVLSLVFWLFFSVLSFVSLRSLAFYVVVQLYFSIL